MVHSKFSSLIFSLLSLLIILNSFDMVLAQQTVGGRLVKSGNYKNRQIEYVDRQIAIKIKQGVTLQDANSIIIQHEANLVKNFDKLQWGLIELPEGFE